MSGVKEALAAWEAVRGFLRLQEEDGGFGDDEEAGERAQQRKAITDALEAAAQEAEAQPAASLWPTEDECQFLIARFAERVFAGRQWLTRDDFAPGMGTRDYLMSLLLELRDTRGKNLGRAELAK